MQMENRLLDTCERFPLEIWEKIVSKIDNPYDLNRLSKVSQDLRDVTNRCWTDHQTKLGISSDKTLSSKESVFKDLSEKEYKRAFLLPTGKRDEKLRALIEKKAPLSIVILDRCLKHRVREDIIEKILKDIKPGDYSLSQALNHSASLKIIKLLLEKNIEISNSNLDLSKERIEKHNRQSKKIYRLIKKTHQKQTSQTMPHRNMRERIKALTLVIFKFRPVKLT